MWCCLWPLLFLGCCGNNHCHHHHHHCDRDDRDDRDDREEAIGCEGRERHECLPINFPTMNVYRNFDRDDHDHCCHK